MIYRIAAPTVFVFLLLLGTTAFAQVDEEELFGSPAGTSEAEEPAGAGDGGSLDGGTDGAGADGTGSADGAGSLEESLFGSPDGGQSNGGQSDGGANGAGADGGTDGDGDGADAGADGAKGAGGTDGGSASGGLISQVEQSDLNMDELLLTNEDTVTIGGDFSFSTSGRWVWEAGEPLKPEDAYDTLSVDLQGRFQLDARPDADTRFYGEAWLTYPFSTSQAQGGDDDGTDGGAVDGADTAGTTGGRSFEDILYVDELFSDFTIVDRLFMRVGKQTMNWGVGYFYSPADLLNLTEIDPEDPEADLEGPVAARANLPTGTSNLYLYGIVPAGAADPTDPAVAGKFEWVLGSAEFGVGAYYQADTAPAAMATATSTFGDLRLFAEGMVSYGSDKTFVVEGGPTGYTTETYEDKLFPHGTVGGSYSWSSDNQNVSVTALAQYYYNGEGYDDSDYVNLTNTPVAALLGAGSISATDLSSPGKHYAAGNLSVGLGDDLRVSALAIANLSHGTGTVQPQLGYTIADAVDVNIGVPYTWGDDGEEYTPALSALSGGDGGASAPGGSTVGLTVSVSMGGVTF